MSQRVTRNRLEQRRQRRRRQTRIQLVIAVSAIAIVVVVILIALNAPGSGEETATPVASVYDGLEQDVITTEVGIGLAIGEPDAPATLVEYSDFSCPHCYDLSLVIDRLIDEYVRPGHLRIVYKPIAFVNPPYSGPAAQAAICAARQGRGWEMMQQIWSLFASSGPGAYSEQQLTREAQTIGLNVDQFRSCFSSTQTAADVEAVITEAQQMGITGTPVVYLNGQQFVFRGPDAIYSDLKSALDAIIANQ